MKEYDLPRVTYIQQPDDLTPFHAMFDDELPQFKAGLGKKWPHMIDGREVWDGDEYTAPSPLDYDLTLGMFLEADKNCVDKAVIAAKKSFPKWGGMPWQDRLVVLRNAAQEMSKRRFELAMAVVYEVGKSRMQAVSEVEEAIDFLYYYSDQMEKNSGYQGEELFDNPGEVARNYLVPFGAFAVISPFNYPVALSLGMMTAALVAGNTIVWKPSPFSGLSAAIVYEIMEQGGLPSGTLNIVYGEQAGPLLSDHPDVDGYAFTGSYEVGMKILQNTARGRYMRPVLAEMGGKNPVYISQSAILDEAVNGVAASAFGMEGQKCTACSVAYVHESIYEEFTQALVAKIERNRPKIGNVENAGYIHGPVVNEATYERYKKATAHGTKNGRVLTGGNRIQKDECQRGFFLEHMIIDQLPEDSYLFTEEQFAPILAIAPFSDLNAAIDNGNRSQYGLTCGFYGVDEAEMEYFMTNAQAGLQYINRRTGATTGAWPGLQSFCGWKGSGLTGKGGLGPHYVAQFMREQNRTMKLL